MNKLYLLMPITCVAILGIFSYKANALRNAGMCTEKLEVNTQNPATLVPTETGYISGYRYTIFIDKQTNEQYVMMNGHTQPLIGRNK